MDYQGYLSEDPSTTCPGLTSADSVTPRTSDEEYFQSDHARGSTYTSPKHLFGRFHEAAQNDALTWPAHTGHITRQTSDTATKPVCYGLLPAIKVRLEVDPNIVHTRPRDSSATFGLSLHKQNFYLNDSERNIAFVSLRLCERLIELQKYDIHSEAYIATADWTKIIAEWRRASRKGREFCVNVLLSGPKQWAKEVGAVLSDHGLYLQTPQGFYPDPPLEVVNPHWLNLPSFTGFDERYKSSDGTKIKNSFTPVRSLFDEASQGDLLEEALVDRRVKSTLYKHQRIAVSFILKKESKTLPSSMGVCQRRVTPGDHVFYEHSITGIKVNDARELNSTGGILADEMGAGKTASLLAAMMTTLDDARLVSKSCRGTCEPTEALPLCPATLVVVPSELLLATWESEIRRHIRPGVLRIHRFHGPGKEIDPGRLANIDIVLTTYATVESDSRPKAHHCLRKVEWYRLVLDEAHVIRSDATKQHASLMAISARFRWCLTGTPMQNRLEDFGSLLQFLRVPYLANRTQFRKHIILPIERDGDSSNLKELLPSVYLRRRRAKFGVSDPIIINKRLLLSCDEQARYEQIKRACGDAIELALSKESLEEKRRYVLSSPLVAHLSHGVDELLLFSNTYIMSPLHLHYCSSRLRQSLRLRIACNNGTFEKPPPAFSHDPFSLRDTSDKTSTDDQCPACVEQNLLGKEDKSSTCNVCGECASQFCEQCLPEYAISVAMNCSAAQKRCHHCRKAFVPPTYAGAASAAHFDQLSDTEVDGNQSTKLNAVVDDIGQHAAKGNK